jgi:hypothetical protein
MEMYGKGKAPVFPDHSENQENDVTKADDFGQGDVIVDKAKGKKVRNV